MIAVISEQGHVKRTSSSPRADVTLGIITSGDAVGARQASYLVETFSIIDSKKIVFAQGFVPHMHMLVCRTASPVKLIHLARLRNKMLSDFLAEPFVLPDGVAVSFRFLGVAGDNKHTCELSASGSGSMQDRCQVCDAPAPEWQKLWTSFPFSQMTSSFVETPNSVRIARYTLVLLEVFVARKEDKILTDKLCLREGLTTQQQKAVRENVRHFRKQYKVRGFPLIAYHNEDAFRIMHGICMKQLDFFLPPSTPRSEIRSREGANALIKAVLQLDALILDRVYTDALVRPACDIAVDSCLYLPSFLHNIKAVVLSYVLHFVLRSIIGKKRTAMANAMLNAIRCKSFFEHFYGKKARACVALGPSHPAFTDMPTCFKQQLSLLTIMAAVCYTHEMHPWQRALLRVCIPLFFLSLDVTKTARLGGSKRWHNQETKADVETKAGVTEAKAEDSAKAKAKADAAEDDDDDVDLDDLLNQLIVTVEEREHIQNILAKPSLYTHNWYHVCQLLDKKNREIFYSFLRINEEAIERKCGEIKLYDRQSGSSTPDDCFDYARSQSVWTQILSRQKDVSALRGHDVAGTDESMKKGVVIFTEAMSFLPHDFIKVTCEVNEDVASCMREIDGLNGAFVICHENDIMCLRDVNGVLSRSQIEHYFHVVCFCKCTHRQWQNAPDKTACAFHAKSNN